jgi:hypothetical protein
MKNNKKEKQAALSPASLPLYCDFSCTYAQFAQPEAVGACRRDLAVYCKLFKKYNNKNSHCIGRTS